jgi:Family of unknown function (DUF6165)
MAELMAPISPGELCDKITILRIKAQRIQDPAKLANVHHELSVLDATWTGSGLASESVEADIAALQAVNERLWVIEDDIRHCEKAGDFGPTFIQLARSVYIENDERAAIKKRINLALGASLIEEKSYAKYR